MVRNQQQEQQGVSSKGWGVHGGGAEGMHALVFAPRIHKLYDSSAFSPMPLQAAARANTCSAAHLKQAGEVEVVAAFGPHLRVVCDGV